MKLKGFWFVVIFWAKRFRKGCQNCFSRLHRSNLGRKIFSIATKTTASFRHRAGMSWSASRKRFASVVKTAFCVSITAFWGKMMLLKRICSYGFRVSRILRKKLWVFAESISAFTSNPNSSRPKQRFWKTQIFWKKLSFFDNFRNLNDGFWILAKPFSRLQWVSLRERFQILLESFGTFSVFDWCSFWLLVEKLQPVC